LQQMARVRSRFAFVLLANRGQGGTKEFGLTLPLVVLRSNTKAHTSARTSHRQKHQAEGYDRITPAGIVTVGLMTVVVLAATIELVRAGGTWTLRYELPPMGLRLTLWSRKAR
jgi:hypothetical protein